MTLKRSDFTAEGIFGQLSDAYGKPVAMTLEHAYDSGNGDGSYIPKVASGEYTCVRGQHKLAHMTQPFTTFMLRDVPDFQGQPVSGILLHVGNYDQDSEGCILLGTGIGTNMITNSRDAFNSFMALQDGVDEFILTVI